MSDLPDASRVPLMPAETAQEIARGLKWLAQSYTTAGMTREATRAERDSHWWLAFANSLAQMPPQQPQDATISIADRIAGIEARIDIRFDQMQSEMARTLEEIVRVLHGNPPG